MIPFFLAPNLAVRQLVEGAPWDFSASAAHLDALRKAPKTERRKHLLKSSTHWQIYSAVRAMDAGSIVSAENQAYGVRGFVADYDLKQPIDAIVGLVNQIPEAFQPQFLEITLGGKARLVWVFEREILVNDSPFCERLWKEFARRSGAENALAGFDAASFKPSERWTNGGEWYTLAKTPIAADLVVGCAIEAGKALTRDARGDIALDVVAVEVQKRFPNRWQGPFELDACGVRFWDAEADAPAGAQVKPDGMLCFTGKVPFMRWSDIFGRAWVDEQVLVKLGSAADGIYFDGRNYWTEGPDRWWTLNRQDVQLRLRAKGLTDKVPKGATVSPAEQVLVHLQTHNRVDGAAPLINYRPGITNVRSQRVLNISSIRGFAPKDGSATPADFPFIHNFLTGHFVHRPEHEDPLPFFLHWLRRSYQSVLDFRPLTGQAIFDCGPRGNGKTLLLCKIVAPLLGHRYANPYDYLVGDTAFTDDLFECFLWLINDEESPRSEVARQKFLSRLKASVVNPVHTYHPKFCARVPVEWVGRLAVSLNDDPHSVGMLPEVNSNTEDKMMFFASAPYAGVWGANAEIESAIAEELPAFARWVLDYNESPEILERTRMGMRSYYDPQVLSLARQQANSHDVRELLTMWIRIAPIWQEPDRTYWEGSATELLAAMSVCDSLSSIVRDYRVNQLAKSLTAIARIDHSGVEYVEGSDRTYRISKASFPTS